MKPQDFKPLLFGVLVYLTLIWLVSSFMAIGYEDGVSATETSKNSYIVAKLINFSFPFYNQLINEYLALLFSLLSSSIIVCSVIIGVNYVLKKVFP